MVILNVRLLGDNMEFEKKIQELQDITKSLEDPNIKMDKGVELYEKGVEILSFSLYIPTAIPSFLFMII